MKPSTSTSVTWQWSASSLRQWGQMVPWIEWRRRMMSVPSMTICASAAVKQLSLTQRLKLLFSCDEMNDIFDMAIVHALHQYATLKHQHTRRRTLTAHTTSVRQRWSARITKFNGTSLPKDVFLIKYSSRMLFKRYGPVYGKLPYFAMLKNPLKNSYILMHMGTTSKI